MRVNFFLVLNFVPQGPELVAPHGTTTRGAGDIDSRRYRDLESQVKVPRDKIKTHLAKISKTTPHYYKKMRFALNDF